MFAEGFFRRNRNNISYLMSSNSFNRHRTILRISNVKSGKSQLTANSKELQYALTINRLHTLSNYYQRRTAEVL